MNVLHLLCKYLSLSNEIFLILNIVTYYLLEHAKCNIVLRAFSQSNTAKMYEINATENSTQITSNIRYNLTYAAWRLRKCNFICAILSYPLTSLRLSETNTTTKNISCIHHNINPICHQYIKQPCLHSINCQVHWALLYLTLILLLRLVQLLRSYSIHSKIPASLYI